ncbi:hypothetical protein J4401_05605 [Candidatus Woesearchaeota archaeon]|nr:hypothetical protein [Candidatus Woesearchaeota archaeon]
MLTSEEKRDLHSSISSKENEVRALRDELNRLNQDKESWFKKKSEISAQIKGLISSLYSNRDMRNTLTKEVREIKSLRDVQNKEIREHIILIKDLEKQKLTALKKHNLQDPSGILKRINDIENKIETEPMLFEKEKELMKKIKELKKQYKDASAVSGIVEKIGTISSEINGLKQKAQKTHRDVQAKAKESQERHEEVIGASGGLKELRRKEEEAFSKFKEVKAKFVETNEKLRKALDELNRMNARLGKDKKETSSMREDRAMMSLQEKKNSVEEKIRKRVKITTEDILAFQEAEKKKFL